MKQLETWRNYLLRFVGAEKLHKCGSHQRRRCDEWIEKSLPQLRGSPATKTATTDGQLE